MKKWYALGAIIVIILGMGYISARKGLDKPDEIQIRELFQRGQEAIEARDLRKAMTCVSKDYKSGNTDYDRLRLTIGQAFAYELKSAVQMEAPTVDVRGDNATATSKVTVTTTNEAGGRDQLFSHELTFHLKKDPLRRYVIYPIREWKIVSCDGLDWAQQENGL